MQLNNLENMETLHIKKEWLKEKEVVVEYPFSKSTLSKWRMNNKNLPFSKIGKFVVYRRSDIETFLNKNKIEVFGGAK